MYTQNMTSYIFSIEVLIRATFNLWQKVSI